MRHFLFQWRRFNFFDKEVVKDPETSQTYDKLKVKLCPKKDSTMQWLGMQTLLFISLSFC